MDPELRPEGGDLPLIAASVHAAPPSAVIHTSIAKKECYSGFLRLRMAE
jgi:hypothetical protein